MANPNTLTSSDNANTAVMDRIDFGSNIGSDDYDVHDRAPRVIDFAIGKLALFDLETRQAAA